MAKRYTQEKKDSVVQFVRSYNEKNGRGGQSAAVAKWSLNPVTLKNWLDKAGVPTPGRRAPESGAVRRRPTSKKQLSELDILRRMAEIKETIAALEAEYAALRETL